MKKEMPKLNHYYPKYWGWRFDQENASVCSLAPLPISICICRGNTIRGILIFFVWECFHLQYLTMKKNKTSKVDHFSSKYGGSKLEEKLIHHPYGRCIPIHHSLCQGNLVRAFCKDFFAMQSWLEYIFNNQKHCKIQAKLHQI